MADSILGATLWKVVMKCKNVMFFNIWTHFWKCIFLRLWHFSSPTTHAVKSIFWAVFQVYKTHVFGEAFFLLSQKHPPLFCQAAPLNLWTVHKPPPHLFRQFPLPNRGFPKHFVIPLFLCFKLSLQKAKGLFSCWRLEEISRGSPEHCKPPSRSRTEPRWGLRDEVPGSSGYMGFENLLL